MTYQLNFEVRSYECDLQGIVNNANYLHYLEHTRHEFLKSIGINFAEMHDEGFDLVVVEANLKYKDSLKSDDKFYVSLDLVAAGRVKFKFLQKIYLKDGDKLVLDAEITGTTIDRARKRPVMLEKLKNICLQQ